MDALIKLSLKRKAVSFFFFLFFLELQKSYQKASYI